MTAHKLTAAEQIERVRNRIAVFIVGSFVGALVAFTFRTIPTGNKDIVTYMVGQLSGMATMALGFYFVNKIGQDAVDAKRADNTGKALDIAAAAGGGIIDPPAGTEADPLIVAGAPAGSPPVRTTPEKRP